jgi:hypothetical protein
MLVPRTLLLILPAMAAANLGPPPLDSKVAPIMDPPKVLFHNVSTAAATSAAATSTAATSTRPAAEKPSGALTGMFSYTFPKGSGIYGEVRINTTEMASGTGDMIAEVANKLELKMPGLIGTTKLPLDDACHDCHATCQACIWVPTCYPM